MAWLAFFDLLPSETKVDEHWPTPLVDVVVCNYENWKFLYRLTNVGYRDHPFKTSACLREEGGSPLPMFADARGGGVLGLPTSAINPQ